MREIAVRPEPEFAGRQQARRPAASAPARKRSPRLAWVKPLMRRPGRTVGFATFAALLTGICINALFFQTARHPAPIFGPASAPRPVAVYRDAPERIVSPRVETAVPVPAPRPQDFASTVQPRVQIDPPKDQIGSFLKTSGSDDSRTVMAAQRALSRLGYGVKVDGVMGASTHQAIEKFEQSRKIPVTGELTARTLKELAAQSRLAAQ